MKPVATRCLFSKPSDDNDYHDDDGGVGDCEDEDDEHFVNRAVEEPLRPLGSALWYQGGQVEGDQGDFALGADFVITLFWNFVHFSPTGTFSQSTSFWDDLGAWF